MGSGATIGVGIFGFIIGLGLTVGVIAILYYCTDVLKSECSTSSVTPSKDNVAEINTSGGPYSKGAVATDSEECSKVGARILKKKGSAVDAAIAAMLCVGVINMHSTGIAGSGFMLIYNRSTRSSEMVNFREKAPGAAYEDMFVNNTDKFLHGGRFIAVPGEVKGYYKAWSKYGKLKWKDLVQPAIDIAKKGFKIGKPVYKAAQDLEDKLKEDPGLKELLFDAGGNLRKEGTTITNLKYAVTLEQIQVNPNSFYNDGQLARDIIRDMKTVEPEGSLSMQDLRRYNVKFVKGFTRRLECHDLHTAPPPASGALLNLILNILKGYNMTPKDRSSALAYHRIVEAFKFASAYRGLLADPDFANASQAVAELLNSRTGDFLRQKIWDDKTHPISYYGKFFSKVDHGTSHLAVLAPNGDAVSMTSSINYRFGCGFRSLSTGIIYNNGMGDFDVPGDMDISSISHLKNKNFPEPGKRPLSSMTPVIITDTYGNVRFIVGASGGKKILTATALTIINWLWFNRNISEAVDDKRVHTHLIPNNTLEVEEPDFPGEIRKGLQDLGHKIINLTHSAVVQAIERRGTLYKDSNNEEIYAKSDPRKNGKPAGY